MKRFVSFMLVLILAFSVFSISASGATGTVLLGTKKVKQSKTNWCWVATSVSVLDYRKNLTVSQDNFAKSVHGNPPGNKLATVSDIINGLSNYGLTTNSSGSLSFSQVQTTIENGKPPIAVYQHNNSLLAHAVVLCGWSIGGGKNTVMYMDPAQGKNITHEYSYFKSNNDWTWTITIK